MGSDQWSWNPLTGEITKNPTREEVVAQAEELEAVRVAVLRRPADEVVADLVVRVVTLEARVKAVEARLDGDGK